MKIEKIVKMIVCFVLFALPMTAFADDLEDGNGAAGGDVQDIPTAPISDYVPLLALGGIVLGYRLLRKRATN